MIHGVGIDIVENGRMEKAVLRWKNAFLERIFTASEISYCYRKALSYGCLAARFAAKEAFIKALGAGASSSAHPLSYKEVEVAIDETGKPGLQFHGRAHTHVASLKIRAAHVSISHERNYSTAVVILEKDETGKE